LHVDFGALYLGTVDLYSSFILFVHCYLRALNYSQEHIIEITFLLYPLLFTCPVSKVKMLNLEMDTALVYKEKHHENELLKSFCKQCKVCICVKCGQTRHNHHARVDIDQAAKEQKGNIQEIAEEMRKGNCDIRLYVERSKELSR